jgi:hypothetical protein
MMAVEADTGMADAASERAVIWGTAQDGRRDGRELVVMMHGRGGKESDLFGLARFFLPEATVVASLRAPIPQGNGYAWYSGSSASELEESVTGVLAWLETLSFTPSGIALMGPGLAENGSSRAGSGGSGVARRLRAGITGALRKDSP